MASVNRVILIGNLGKDPESRYMQDGTQVCNISLAMSEKWTDKSGAKQEKTEWVNVVFYKKLAEIVTEYLRKGSQVYVEGRLETRKYTDKNGIERYTTQIIANEMRMLGSKPESISQQQQESRTQNKANVSGFEDSDIDDIPFN